MPSTINTSLVGKEYPPYAVTVERVKIKEFARAIGDLNPLYLDDRIGAASPWGDIIAPPTFAITLKDETADTAAFLKELGTEISRILHGEQEFEYFRPLMPGERYLIVQLHEMLTFLGQAGVATLLISAQHGFVGSNMTAAVDASYLADAVILLRYFEAHGEVRQAISVLK